MQIAHLATNRYAHSRLILLFESERKKKMLRDTYIQGYCINTAPSSFAYIEGVALLNILELPLLLLCAPVSRSTVQPVYFVCVTDLQDDGKIKALNFLYTHRNIHSQIPIS